MRRNGRQRNSTSARPASRGETESAYLIDFHFAASPNWAVIHDLRVEHNGRVAQVDHLLINRWMECYVLESKHFNTGIKITEAGEFMRWNDYKRMYEGMPSPLQQNERHIAVLRDVMGTLELPTRLGVRITFAFQTLVLVSPDARIDRPARFDSSRVIKADQIKDSIFQLDLGLDHERAAVGPPGHRAGGEQTNAGGGHAQAPPGKVRPAWRPAADDGMSAGSVEMTTPFQLRLPISDR